MSFKKLSIVAVFFFVALLLLFYPSPTHFPKTSLTVSQVLAAATQNITKRVASLTIQDQQVDLNDPNATVNITLSADSPSVPIVITYDDGQTRYLAYTFNYKPPAQPAPAFCSNEDFATACWQGAQCQEENQESADTACSQNHGAGSVCTRSTGQPNTHDDGCTIMTEPAPPPPAAPSEPSCGEYQYVRAECDWGRQQVYEVYQDACGNYDRRNYQTQPGQCGARPVSTAPGCNSSDDFSEYVRCGGCGEEVWACYDEDGRHERRFYGSDTAGYCTGSDWCGGGGSQPPPPPEPSCGDFEYKYWECDWDNQQTYDVYQDSCGNYDRRDYHTVEGLCGAPE